MSHTDKHRPLYVQLADETNPSAWKAEEHDHRNGVCDLSVLAEKAMDARVGRRLTLFLGRTANSQSCYLWPSTFGWKQGMWSRGHARPRTLVEHGIPRDGGARMRLRALRHKWLHTTDVDDIDSFEDLPTPKFLSHKWWKD
jgi:hypothetical protein